MSNHFFEILRAGINTVACVFYVVIATITHPINKTIIFEIMWWSSAKCKDCPHNNNDLKGRCKLQTSK